MEVQEGKITMSNKEHHHLGSTFSCVLRQVAETSMFKSFSIEDNTQDDIERDCKRFSFDNS